MPNKVIKFEVKRQIIKRLHVKTAMANLYRWFFG